MRTRHYRYKPDVLEQLLTHGVRPQPDTAPELVRDYVNDLYRYELRRLRDRLRRHEFPKAAYYDLVVALRRKYPVLSLQPAQFVE